ncbi:MAG: hypothetical protein ABFD94_18140, partial [Armatimonadia bacterium]
KNSAFEGFNATGDAGECLARVAAAGAEDGDRVPVGAEDGSGKRSGLFGGDGSGGREQQEPHQQRAA